MWYDKSDVVIRVERLGKRYRIGERERYRVLRDTLADWLYASFRHLRSRFQRSDGQPLRRSDDSHIWSLRDISFEIREGEVVGIIGRNGAGKTTLLKVLSRVTKPTEGHATIRGRVGSLLEVGTGFHPELTGRENVYFNGAILGMTKAEITRKFDEIVAFAEVEKFIDTPVKRYSSGMFVRLAFAVAAHLEPEILLVDEVLAVGDASFQKKCLGKMGDVAKAGRTILFVSHNMTAVQRLCSRTLWLHDGRLHDAGESGQVVSNYLKTVFSPLAERSWTEMAAAPGNDKVRLCRARVRPLNGSAADPITVRTPFAIEFEYLNLVPGACLNLSLHLLTAEGATVFNTVPVAEPVWHGRPFPRGRFRSVCVVPGDLLNDGTYRVQLLVVRDQSVVIFSYDDLLTFEVGEAVETRNFWFGKWAGAVRPMLQWTTELIGPELPPGLTRTTTHSA